MVKSVTSISIDTEVLELAKLRFPRKISILFEGFLRGIMDAETPDSSDKESKELQADLLKAEESLKKAKIKRDSLLIQTNERTEDEEEEYQKNLKERIEVFKAMKNARVMK